MDRNRVSQQGSWYLMQGRTRAFGAQFFSPFFASAAAIAAWVALPTLIQTSTDPAGAREATGDGVQPVLVLSNSAPAMPGKSVTTSLGHPAAKGGLA